MHYFGSTRVSDFHRFGSPFWNQFCLTKGQIFAFYSSVKALNVSLWHISTLQRLIVGYAGVKLDMTGRVHGLAIHVHGDKWDRIA